MKEILWITPLPEMHRMEIQAIRAIARLEIVENPYEAMSRLQRPDFDVIILEKINININQLKIEEKTYRTRGGLDTGLVLYRFFIHGKYPGKVIFYTAVPEHFLNKKLFIPPAMYIHSGNPRELINHCM